MYYYLANVQYAGSKYAGFQWQSNLITIQDELNKAINTYTQNKITTTAASRTDTGVHAFNQLLKITSAVPIEPIDGIFAINQLLPPDIKLKTLNTVHGSFKPSAQTISKEYLYLFTNSAKSMDAREQEFIANFGKKLNMDLIQEALPLFIGEHNFQNFYSKGSNVTSTVRTIISIELKIINPHEIFRDSLFSAPEQLTECYQLKINGSGFLKQMIRHIVSSLWMVGTEKITNAQLKEFIDGDQQVNQLWKVAPPNGLFLNNINY